MRDQFIISAAHAAGPAERGLGLWLNACGHYRTREHILRERIRDDWLVMHVVAGSGTLRNGAHRISVPCGAAVACFPSVPHEFACDPAGGWEIRWAHFAGPVAARLVALCGLSPSRPMILPGVDADLVAHWSGLLQAVQAHGPHAGIDASARLYRILVDLARLGSVGGHDQDRLIAAAASAPDSLDAMARAAGMSRFAFARAFKRALGITPWRYVLLQRVAQAKQMLAGTDLPAKEVAAACGFADPDYFCRAFRRESGTSPGAYRRQRT